jgi:tetratricopeptide (TPR) repeat protein
MKKYEIIKFFEKEKSTPDSIEKVERIINLGRTAWNIADYSDTKKILEYTLDLANQLNYKSGIVIAYNALGSLIKDQRKSLDYFFKALEIAESEKNHQGTLFCLSNIGIVFKQNLLFDKAIEFYQKVIDYEPIPESEKNILMPIKLMTLMNLGVVYIQINEYDKALNCLLKSLENDKDFSLDKKNLNYCNKLLNIAMAYLKKNDAEKALQYIEEAEIINKEFKNADVETYIYFLKGYNMNMFGYYDSAELYLLNALKIFNESFRLVSKDSIIQELINIYKATKSYEKAIKWQDELILYLRNEINQIFFNASETFL